MISHYLDNAIIFNGDLYFEPIAILDFYHLYI